MQNTRKILATEAPAPKPERTRDHAAEDETRTTVPLKLRVRQEIIDATDEAASKANMNRSAYFTALILGQNIAPTSGWERAADNTLLTIAGHRIMKAIAAVTERIQSGENCDAVLAELQLIRRDIVRGQLTLRPEYEAYLDERAKADSWANREAK